jgi:hypothetical protein
VEAVKWYRKAAEQNYAGAQFNLGFCYANGQGVAKDNVEGYKWFSWRQHKAMRTLRKARPLQRVG